MSQHFPVLIVLLPLTAALLSPFFSYFHKHMGKWVAVASLFGAFLCSVGLLMQTAFVENDGGDLKAMLDRLFANAIKECKR
jgi:formate hydrogenlyase subunit 3/multisubunit Na+/H+ antiporter MnhD subunit